MNYQPHNNGNNQVSKLNSDATSAILISEKIEIVKQFGEPVDRRGVKVRKVTTTKLVPRRTFIKGTLKGKYWGEHENDDTLLKDVGQFYNITLYESEIFVDREGIRTGDSITFSDFLAGISKTSSFTSHQHIDPSQLKNNVLVVHYEGSVNRYKIDLHEPRLYNTNIVHALHQSSDQEVFGSIESSICGYLLDKKEVVEESYDVVEDIPALPVPPILIRDSTVDNVIEQEGTNTIDNRTIPEQEEHINDNNDKSKRWRNKWSLLPLLLLFLLCLLAFLSSSYPSLWILPIAALLFFVFQKASFKLPNWINAILFLLIGIMLWNAFKHNPTIVDTVSGLVKKTFNGGNDDENQPENDGISPSKSVKKVQDQTATNIPNKTENVERSESVGQKGVPPLVLPKDIAKKTEKDLIEKVDDTNPPPVNTKLPSFNSYLDKGLKAVEDEEYKLANQNFKQASNLDPNNPRLKQLADRFRKLADEKCQDIKNANSYEILKHIPNNYYQYAASLTQTTPLKCE